MSESVVEAAAESATAAAQTLGVAEILESLGLPSADAVGISEAAYAAILVLAVLSVFWLLTKIIFGGGGGGGSGGGDSVLLCGACGAGKTSLFQMLRSGSTFEGTVTSMTENEDRFAVEGKVGKKGVVSKQVHVVDLPGHPRLRAKVDKYAAGAKGVVFLVDAVEFTSQRRAVAEQLFELLSNPVVQKRRLPILLAGGKSGRQCLLLRGWVAKLERRERFHFCENLLTRPSSPSSDESCEALPSASSPPPSLSLTPALARQFTGPRHSSLCFPTFRVELK